MKIYLTLLELFVLPESEQQIISKALVALLSFLVLPKRLLIFICYKIPPSLVIASISRSIVNFCPLSCRQRFLSCMAFSVYEAVRVACLSCG